MRPFLFFSAALAIATAARAEQRFSSSGTRVSLIELYTSEGCSSCPSAERWLGALRDAPGLWRDFVPVEFHVNYWDRLGWPDRFASREATQREYAHAAAWGSGTVYTPCFVRDGAEWHASPQPPSALSEMTGALTVTVDQAQVCHVEFTPDAKAPVENLEVNLALLGSGFTSRVTAGENHGETLRHEFVVIALTAQPMVPAPDSPVCRAELPLPKPKISDAPRHALAVWVTRRDQLPPLQATGGWLIP